MSWLISLLLASSVFSGGTTTPYRTNQNFDNTVRKES